MTFTTKMTEQYVQNLYQQNAKNTKDVKEAYNRSQPKKADGQAKQPEQEENAAVYDGSVQHEKPATYTRPMAMNKKNDLQTKLDATYEALSEEAKSYLEELKAKFGDIDFFVADCATDEEMNRYFAMGTKKYSCVISSSILEKMATDEEIRTKYEGIIDGADEKIEEAREEVAEELGEEAAEQIESFGISIDDNGVVTYFAKLKESNDACYEKLKEKREEAKEADEKKADKAKEKEHKARPEEKKFEFIKADSMEGLVAALKEALEKKE